MPPAVENIEPGPLPLGRDSRSLRWRALPGAIDVATILAIGNLAVETAEHLF